MPISNWKKELLTIPNMLSIFRLVLIPVYITIYLGATEPAHYAIAAGILVISCLTDMLDGKIARKFNMISNLGKILDPMADKATQLALIICLLTTYPQLLFMMILFLVKEFFQLFAFVFNLRKGKVLDGALFIGKVCTTVLFVTLTVMILLPNLSATVSGLLIGINCFFLLIALIEYVRAFFGKHKKVKDFEQET